MKKYILLVLAIISIIYVSQNKMQEETIIPDEAIRFRVIANSNTVYDQNIKIQVRNTVQNKMFELLKGVDNLEETRNIIKENVENINKLVKETLEKSNYDEDFEVKYGYNYFPKKKYKGIVYKKGKYESLVIELGKADGDNFWCVLFPPLCLVEVEEEKTTDAEYTFFVKELINKYLFK